MNILKSISEFLDNLDLKDLYKYIGIALGITLLFVSFIVYRFYSSVDDYKREIYKINEQREDIQKLLEKANLINEQKQEVNDILDDEPYFKIKGYFDDDVLAPLKLTNKCISQQGGRAQLGDYEESILIAKCSDMNMKELTDLLNQLEQKKRVYTKELEIQKVQKSPTSLKVELTIATLQPRSEPADFLE